MSASERIVAFHIARLKDKDPQVRLRAINELVLLGATDTLDVLEQVYRTDPDRDVRKAAQKAGRTLFFSGKPNR